LQRNPGRKGCSFTVPLKKDTGRLLNAGTVPMQLNWLAALPQQTDSEIFQNRSAKP
jgi:hypothetical protein